MRKLSIIVPTYYNEKNIGPLYKKLSDDVLSKLDDIDYELIFVDDGSGDNTVKEIEKLQKDRKSISLVKLSRNFGSHAAILAGLSVSSGDCATFISADLQDPPSIIMRMLSKWQSGADAVIAVRENREEPVVQKTLSNLYYKIMRKIAIKEMPNGGFDCFLIDRKIVSILTRMNEKNTSLMGLILWCGFKLEKIYYTRKAREIGKSKWTFSKKIKLFTDSILSFSFFPIRAITVIGIIAFFSSLIWLIIIVLNKIIGNIQVEGYTTLILVMLGSSGLILLALGIIGEYLWRVLDESRNRPPFVIDEIIASSENNSKGEK